MLYDIYQKTLWMWPEKIPPYTYIHMASGHLSARAVMHRHTALSFMQLPSSSAYQSRCLHLSTSSSLDKAQLGYGALRYFPRFSPIHLYHLLTCKSSVGNNSARLSFLFHYCSVTAILVLFSENILSCK